MLLFVHKSLLLLVNLYLQVEIEVNLNLKVTLQTFVSNKSKFVCTFTFIYKFNFVHNFICNFTNKSILVCKSKSILVCISKLVCTSRNISEVNVYFFCVVGHMCESTLQFSWFCNSEMVHFVFSLFLFLSLYLICRSNWLKPCCGKRAALWQVCLLSAGFNCFLVACVVLVVLLLTVELLIDAKLLQCEYKKGFRSL